MNEINFDIENIIDGVKTYRGKNPKFIYSPKQVKFQNSPINKMIKYLNPNTNKKPQDISKNINSTTNLKVQKLTSLNNIINKKDKAYINEKIFQNRILNDQLLFKKKLKSDNLNDNKILTAKPKIFNNETYIKNIYLDTNEHKINKNFMVEHKYHHLINKYNNKRSSSVMNANKGNEKIKKINNLTYKGSYFTKKYNNEISKTKISKTQNKKMFINKNEEINNSKKILKINKNVDVEENHFKAVSYTQAIKKLSKNIN